ncbi:hypothetical protein [Pantoea trifolii]|uniref:hypothetical protein n=1 Tax=Candidatus Pantoea symbiotica TaxID=1884370 RepID=UPI002413495F|nr:hypothetical protein [Pantoea rodasii]
MRVTEHEMRGLLTGKCVPADMLVNEELPAYLVRKFAALQQKLDAVTAEAAYLRNEIKQHSECTHQCEVCGEADPCNTDDVCLALNHPLPATDGILNDVRAEGAEMFASYWERNCAHDDTFVGKKAKHFAAQLRTGSNEGGV